MKCFIIMPFHKKYDPVCKAILDASEVVSEHEKIIAIRGDHKQAAGKITERIEKEIVESQFCIAVISDLNANVMWETGYAIALKKPVIIVSSNRKEIPFDLRDYFNIEYDYNNLEKLKVDLVSAIGNTIEEVKDNGYIQELIQNNKFIRPFFKDDFVENRENLLNDLTSSFGEFNDKLLEKDFQEFNIELHIEQIRFYCWLGIATILVYIFLDYFLCKQSENFSVFYTILFIRLLLAFFVAMVLAFSVNRHFKPNATKIIIFTSTLVGMGVIAIIYIANFNAPILYVGGIVTVYMFIGLLFNLAVKPILFSMLSIFVAYVCVLFSKSIGGSVEAWSNYFLLISCISVILIANRERNLQDRLFYLEEQYKRFKE